MSTFIKREFNRRSALRLGAVTGLATVVPWRFDAVAAAAIPGGTLDPLAVPKYVTPLVIPPAMPRTATLARNTVDHYVIGVRQFRQQILPSGPATTVWSYGSQSQKRTFNYPAFTVEATAGRPVRVTWVNGLVDGNGRYLPHLLAVDPTLHWANPAGGTAGRDSRPEFASTPGNYTGPVPIVTHLHGGHSAEEADGHPEAWYLPNARNIPSRYARVGSIYEEFEGQYAEQFGQPWDAGSAVFQYDNDQPAGTMWYHDHTLGMTRLNVYAGPAGFYQLRGGAYDLPAGELPGPAPQRGDAAGTRYREISLAIQDRSFNADGSLFYPDSRTFFDEFGGPFIPDSDVSPIWNPEFFGNTMVVNGRTWPELEVEPARYRFRFLNGCNSRFLILKIASSALAARPAAPALPFWQIGAEGGFLPAPAELGQLLMGPAERADCIVDFTGLPVGTELYLINEAPDSPFGGGELGVDFDPADPHTTGQVMRLRVVAATAADNSTPPHALTLPAPPKPGTATVTRRVSLNEADSEEVPEFGPTAAFLGVLNTDGTGRSLGWEDPVTEDVAVGTTEVWELHNFTEDAHPIHIHEVQFEVVDREPFGGPSRPPEPGETGLKDTVTAFPGEITRVKARFDRSGRYVWHCHIVEHEDNEMMRPYRIG